MTFDLARYNLTNSLKHLVQVKVYSGASIVDIPVIAGTLTFDEDDVFIRSTIQTPVPEPDIQALLDPRIRPHMAIWLGYEVQGITELEHVCNLDLREAIVSQPEGILTLNAASREERIHDTAVIYSPITFTAASDAGASIKALIETHDPASIGAVLNELSSRAFLLGTETLVEEAGTDPWQIVQEILDRSGAVAYWDGFHWRIHEDAAISGDTVLFLSTGNSGIVKQYQTILAREPNFVNTVLVRHRWNDGTNDQEVLGVAQVQDGPFGWVSSGRRLKTIDKEVPVSQASANATAQTLLNRGITRGREIIVTAVSAYWLRPFQTVQITNIPGYTERHIVKSVQFTLESGEMNVKTRLPEDVEIV